MSNKVLQRVRDAILEHRYALSEHAYDEMTEDELDALDVEAAILTGKIVKIQSKDARGRRYVLIGTACDQSTPVGVVVRFVEQDQLLIITAYEIE
ncbi:MAG: DUF4258 domain-containing protein [Planctomycetes bacterium]|nr:DUF4258 domain-containing protein [Planctomycetota bacterium]